MGKPKKEIYCHILFKYDIFKKLCILLNILIAIYFVKIPLPVNW